ncbi:MAG: hypothetical protein AABX70_02100 [Nanoarchaeota archaeon]
MPTLQIPARRNPIVRDLRVRCWTEGEPTQFIQEGTEQVVVKRHITGPPPICSHVTIGGFKRSEMYETPSRSKGLLGNTVIDVEPIRDEGLVAKIRDQYCLEWFERINRCLSAQWNHPAI